MCVCRGKLIQPLWIHLADFVSHHSPSGCCTRVVVRVCARHSLQLLLGYVCVRFVRVCLCMLLRVHHTTSLSLTACNYGLLLSHNAAVNRWSQPVTVTHPGIHRTAGRTQRVSDWSDQPLLWLDAFVWTTAEITLFKKAFTVLRLDEDWPFGMT